MKTAVLKPGYLVSLRTNLRGGVNYQRIDIEADHTTDEGARRARWETKREIPDPEEFKRATEARGKARALVARACCQSAFGLLCPTSNEGELFDAIEAARAIADAHNAEAKLSYIGVNVLVGRIASDDAEAARAIASEIRELLDQMRQGIAEADPAAIREAANKARALGGMLSTEVAGKVSAAIIEARTAAREITARVQKAGETAATVVAECSTQRIDSARFSFLDLEDGEQGAVTAEAPAGRGIDLEPAPDAPPPVATAPRALEFELGA